jgi:hypothetical protein
MVVQPSEDSARLVPVGVVHGASGDVLRSGGSRSV